MKTNSNTYTIIYAAVLVVIVAFLLAFVSKSLKATQDRNVELDIKKQILASLNIRDLNNDDAAAKYDEVVKKEEQLKDSLTLYTCNVDGQVKYIIPLKGMGLWGPIGGYISIDEDKETVYGAYFTHEGETAGLGAEIKDSKKWQDLFHGKKIFKEGVDGVALSVEKKVTDPTTQVDCVTGATLTSDGVREMLKECIGEYNEFLKAK